MKKLLLTAVAVLASLNLFAQGTVNFQNTSTTRVYAGSTSTPAGAGYNVALYWAPDGVTDDAAYTQVGGAAGLTSGIFAGGTRTLPIAPGGFAQVQVRGWATSFGSTYETALAAGGATGKSTVFRVDTGDPTTTPPGTPASLAASGFQSFVIVPEPSAIALGILGAGALLLLRRRK